MRSCLTWESYTRSITAMTVSFFLIDSWQYRN
jgi:hypothetical protein